MAHETKILASMLLSNIFMISSIFYVVSARTNNSSLNMVACVTADIIKMYQSHRMYLLHSSYGRGKF